MPVYDFSSGLNALGSGLDTLGASIKSADYQAKTVALSQQLSSGDIDGAINTAGQMGDVNTVLKLRQLKQSAALDQTLGAGFGAVAASYGQGGGAGSGYAAGGGASPSASASAGTPPGYTMPASDVAGYIRQAAIARGIDPGKALYVFSKEGASNYVGDDGSSFGPLQLHMGGISDKYPNSGMGDDFQKATGLDPRDPSTVKAQIDFGLDQAAKNGWSAWTSQQGRPTFEGIGPNAQPRGVSVAGGAGQAIPGSPQVAPAGLSVPQIAAGSQTIGAGPTVPGSGGVPSAPLVAASIPGNISPSPRPVGIAATPGAAAPDVTSASSLPGGAAASILSRPEARIIAAQIGPAATVKLLVGPPDTPMTSIVDPSVLSPADRIKTASQFQHDILARAGFTGAAPAAAAAAPAQAKPDATPSSATQVIYRSQDGTEYPRAAGDPPLNPADVIVSSGGQPPTPAAQPQRLAYAAPGIPARDTAPAAAPVSDAAQMQALLYNGAPQGGQAPAAGFSPGVTPPRGGWYPDAEQPQMPLPTDVPPPGGFPPPAPLPGASAAPPVVPGPGAVPAALPPAAAPVPAAAAAPLAISVPNYKGTFTRAQAEAAPESDDNTPSTDEWDAAAKAQGALQAPVGPGAAVAGPGAPAPAGGAPGATGAVPNVKIPPTPAAQRAGDPALAAAARVSPQIAQSLAQTLPGTDQRMLLLARMALAAGGSSNPEGAKAAVQMLMDIEKQHQAQFEKQQRILSPQQAAAAGLPDPGTNNLWQADAFGNVKKIEGVPPPAQILTDEQAKAANLPDIGAGSRWTKDAAGNYHSLSAPTDTTKNYVPIVPGSAEAKQYPGAVAIIHGGADEGKPVYPPGPVASVTVDQRGMSDIEKAAAKRLDEGYTSVRSGAIPSLIAANRMQSSLNAGIISGWGAGEPAVKKFAEIMSAIGLGDKRLVSNTQDYVRSAIQEFLPQGRAMFPGRFTNADVTITGLMSGTDPSNTLDALNAALASARQRAGLVIQQHNENVERYANSFRNQADTVRGLYKIDPNNLPSPIQPATPGGGQVILKSGGAYTWSPDGGFKEKASAPQ